MSITATHPPHARPWSAHLICMLAMMAWSTGLPANTFLLPVLHPLALATLRLVFGAMVLLPFWLAQDGAAALRRADWRTGLGIGAWSVWAA